MAAQTDDLKEVTVEIAAVAGELYSALPAVELDDRAGRGFKKFDKDQAFELTRVFFYEAIKEADLL